MKKIFFVMLAAVLICSVQAQESRRYVENQLLIWLEQGVDAYEFASNSNQAIAPCLDKALPCSYYQNRFYLKKIVAK